MSDFTIPPLYKKLDKLFRNPALNFNLFNILRETGHDMTFSFIGNNNTFAINVRLENKKDIRIFLINGHLLKGEDIIAMSYRPDEGSSEKWVYHKYIRPRKEKFFKKTVAEFYKVRLYVRSEVDNLLPVTK